VAAALFLRQDVDLGLELRVGRDRAGLGHDLAALHFLALRAAQQHADVVAGAPFFEGLAEHLDARADRFEGGPDADDLHFVARADDPAVHAARHDGAAAGDAEDVAHGHQEGLVEVALGLGDVAVDGVHELEDALGVGRAGVVGLQGLQGGAADDGCLVAGEGILRKQLPELELDEVEQFGVVDEVDLVHEDEHVGNLHLAGQQDVLTGLGHGAFGGGDDEDGSVHVGGARDHVFDVVGVTRAVDVRVVALRRLVLHVGDVDGHAALFFLRRVVDHIKGHELGQSLRREMLRDRGSQRGLAVIHVPDGPDIDVRLRPFEFFLRHLQLPPYLPYDDRC